MTHEPIDLAWAAGVFEGEGSIRINTPTKRNRGSLLADMVNGIPEIVRFFNERWPGYFRYMEAKGRKRGYWRWRIAARKAAVFLSEIAPYIRSAKYRKRLALALEFQAQKTTDQKICRDPAYIARQGHYYERMKDLNRRGTR